jgi:predicted RNase H-like HicB family nuclease
MTEYTVIIEDAGTNFAAYVPDLPGPRRWCGHRPRT